MHAAATGGPNPAEEATWKAYSKLPARPCATTPAHSPALAHPCLRRWTHAPPPHHHQSTRQLEESQRALQEESRRRFAAEGAAAGATQVRPLREELHGARRQLALSQQREAELRRELAGLKRQVGACWVGAERQMRGVDLRVCKEKGVKERQIQAEHQCWNGTGMFLPHE